MKFTKMQGLGNDFIIIENHDKKYDMSNLPVKRLCDRHLGIGADGILLIEDSNTADAKMTIINSDGSLAEMCGNGIRCYAKYVYEKNICKKPYITIETLAGIMKAEMEAVNGKVNSVKINMGAPVFKKDLIPFKSEMNNLDYVILAGGREFRASTILMGVPHTVVYIDGISKDEMIHYGSIIEKMNIYPNRTNVNFVKIIDKNNIELQTIERGAGLTLACGTGTCASAVCSSILGFTAKKINAHLKAGILNIEYDGQNVFMKGPAEFVFEGEI